MTHQEYYEKYWKVDGKQPPPLSDMDKKLLALLDASKRGDIDIEDIRRFPKRICGYTLMLKLKEDYEKLPDFLKQTTKQLK